MEDWEQEVDSINWKTMLAEIDQALLDNLAAEIGFRSFENLENASGLVANDNYICHLSDGRWAYWNPQTYSTEDPKFFVDKDSAILYIAQTFALDEEKVDQLRTGFNRVHPSFHCLECNYEFQPQREPAEWDITKYCSAECAMEAVLLEMKEDFIE